MWDLFSDVYFNPGTTTNSNETQGRCTLPVNKDTHTVFPFEGRHPSTIIIEMRGKNLKQQGNQYASGQSVLYSIVEYAPPLSTPHRNCLLFLSICPCCCYIAQRRQLTTTTLTLSPAIIQMHPHENIKNNLSRFNLKCTPKSFCLLNITLYSFGLGVITIIVILVLFRLPEGTESTTMLQLFVQGNKVEAEEEKF